MGFQSELRDSQKSCIAVQRSGTALTCICRDTWNQLRRRKDLLLCIPRMYEQSLCLNFLNTSQVTVMHLCIVVYIPLKLKNMGYPQYQLCTHTLVIHTLSSFVGVTDRREKPETSILPEYGNKMLCQMAPESAVIQTYEFWIQQRLMSCSRKATQQMVN